MSQAIQQTAGVPRYGRQAFAALVAEQQTKAKREAELASESVRDARRVYAAANGAEHLNAILDEGHASAGETYRCASEALNYLESQPGLKVLFGHCGGRVLIDPTGDKTGGLPRGWALIWPLYNAKGEIDGVLQEAMDAVGRVTSKLRGLKQGRRISAPGFGPHSRTMVIGVDLASVAAIRELSYPENGYPENDEPGSKAEACAASVMVDNMNFGLPKQFWTPDALDALGKDYDKFYILASQDNKSFAEAGGRAILAHFGDAKQVWVAAPPGPPAGQPVIGTAGQLTWANVASAIMSAQPREFAGWDTIEDETSRHYWESDLADRNRQHLRTTLLGAMEHPPAGNDAARFGGEPEDAGLKVWHKETKLSGNGKARRDENDPGALPSLRHDALARITLEEHAADRDGINRRLRERLDEIMSATVRKPHIMACTTGVGKTGAAIDFLGQSTEPVVYTTPTKAERDAVVKELSEKYPGRCDDMHVHYGRGPENCPRFDKVQEMGERGRSPMSNLCLTCPHNPAAIATGRVKVDKDAPPVAPCAYIMARNQAPAALILITTTSSLDEKSDLAFYTPRRSPGAAAEAGEQQQAGGGTKIRRLKITDESMPTDTQIDVDYDDVYAVFNLVAPALEKLERKLQAQPHEVSKSEEWFDACLRRLKNEEAKARLTRPGGTYEIMLAIEAARLDLDDDVVERLEGELARLTARQFDELYLTGDTGRVVDVEEARDKAAHAWKRLQRQDRICATMPGLIDNVIRQWTQKLKRGLDELRNQMIQSGGPDEMHALTPENCSEFLEVAQNIPPAARKLDGTLVEDVALSLSLHRPLPRAWIEKLGFAIANRTAWVVKGKIVGRYPAAQWKDFLTNGGVMLDATPSQRAKADVVAAGGKIEVFRVNELTRLSQFGPALIGRGGLKNPKVLAKHIERIISRIKLFEAKGQKWALLTYMRIAQKLIELHPEWRDHIGWWGKHEKAHNDWSCLKGYRALIIYGMPILPPEIQRLGYATDRQSIGGAEWNGATVKRASVAIREWVDSKIEVVSAASCPPRLRLGNG